MHTDQLRPGRPARAFSLWGLPDITNVREVPHALRALAQPAKRLPPPDHRNPHGFHEARDELGNLEIRARVLECALGGASRTADRRTSSVR
jgi:hypothetical protein